MRFFHTVSDKHHDEPPQCERAASHCLDYEYLWIQVEMLDVAKIEKELKYAYIQWSNHSRRHIELHQD